MHIQEEEYDNKGDATEWQINEPQPAPGHELAEGAAQDGADSTCCCPYAFKRAKIEASFPGEVSMGRKAQDSGTNRMLNRSLIVMLTSSIRPPEAVPWMARPTMSIPILVATPQMIELNEKTATAARRRGLRPQISDSLAQIGPAAAFAKA